MTTQFTHTRRIWAYLTANPQASIREMRDELGIHQEAVQQAIDDLVECGHIERAPRIARGRRVITPLYTEFVIHERPSA